MKISPPTRAGALTRFYFIMLLLPPGAHTALAQQHQLLFPPHQFSTGKTGSVQTLKSHESSTDSQEGESDDKPEPEQNEEKRPEKADGPVRLFPEYTFGANDEFKLNIDGDTRYRYEYRDNYDLDKDRGDRNAHPQFVRSRVRFDLLYEDLVRVFLEITDNREWNRQDGDPSQHNPLDVQQLYVELRQPGEGPWSVRLGRQEMPLGRDKTLFDASSWSNNRRRYLGARGMYRTEKLDMDLFLMHPEYFEHRHNGGEISGRGRARSDEWLYGAYITSRFRPGHTVESYAIGLSDTNDHRTFPDEVTSEDGTFGSTDRYTIGSVFYGPLAKTRAGELTYTVEGAYQFGHVSKDPISAYLLRGDITHHWENHKWKPTLGLVGTLASGDRDPDDGHAGTFDQLFGSTHSPYGIMDFFRANNLRELGLVGTVQPTEKLTLEAEAHAYWADSKTDTAIRPPGASSLRDKTGGSGRTLGQEFSLLAKYKWSENISIEAGAAHFHTGSYGDSLGRGDNANFFFMQTVVKF